MRKDGNQWAARPCLLLPSSSLALAQWLAHPCPPGSRMMASADRPLLNYGSGDLEGGGSRAPYD